jgi:hypothetical protein
VGEDKAVFMTMQLSMWQARASSIRVAQHSLRRKTSAASWLGQDSEPPLLTGALPLDRLFDECLVGLVHRLMHQGDVSDLFHCRACLQLRTLVIRYYPIACVTMRSKNQTFSAARQQLNAGRQAMTSWVQISRWKRKLLSTWETWCEE